MSRRSYYVDEAGDGTLFDRKGKVLIGNEGCSKFFILGVLDLKNQEILVQELENLRQSLIADPYFKNVPSMQPAARKTYVSFHAKDDLPEVRREVFSIIRKHELGFLAVVRNKRRVLDYVRQRQSQDGAYRYHPNELYDYMVRILFKNLLHQEDEYEVIFSKRGKQDRTESLKDALVRAQQRFAAQWPEKNRSILHVFPQKSIDNTVLQIADYFLWSLQRFYELREDRFLEYLWPSFRLVHDLDDTRENRYGRYYTQKKPLTLAAFDDSSPGI